jgi:simple sugar transport system permease protein
MALVFSSIFILALGFNPVEVFSKMITKAFFTSQGITRSISGALPLMLCGLSVALGFRMNLNNIGAEGQYAIGALVGGNVALTIPDLPIALKLILVFLACFIGGLGWAMLAAIPKAFFDVNEIITTLMLNYVALLIMDYLCYGPWKEQGKNVGQTIKISKDMWIGTIPGTQISAVLIIVILISVLLYLFFKHTTAGFELSVIGSSIEAAKYAGMSIKKNTLLVLGVSGGLAGLAGFMQITGVVHRVTAGMPNNAGYTAIVIAYLARFNPFAVLVVSVLISGLQNSSSTVQVMGVPSDISSMLQGSIMLFVIAGEFFYNNRIRFIRKAGEKH